MRVSNAARMYAVKNLGAKSNAKDADLVEMFAQAVSKGTITEKRVESLMKERDVTPVKLFGSAATGQSKRYSPEREQAKHAKTGKPVMYGGKPVKTTSQLQLAKMGAWARFMTLRSGAALRPLDDHERGLVNEMLTHDNFHVGLPDQEGNFRTAKGHEVKSILNDTTSGGLYSTPYWFDQAFISYPLLHSELLPFVDVKDMPLSNRIESFALGNVTVGWGTAEGTAITPFDTTSLISEIQASAFPVQIACEVGRDWMNDSPVNVGQALVEVVGQRMMSELDKVIAVGDGTTQPQGFTNASGFVAINSDNGTAGPPTVADAESLIFGLPKQYRQRSEWNPSFVCNDTTYRRYRAIQVGPADERRVFGMDEQSYRLLDYPVRISANMTNNKILFAAMRKYRMWRREGFEIRWADLGQTLMLKNTALLVVRGRFAGKLLDPNAMAMSVDAEA